MFGSLRKNCKSRPKILPKVQNIEKNWTYFNKQGLKRKFIATESRRFGPMTFSALEKRRFGHNILGHFGPAGRLGPRI